ncbi:hypothetical protein [Cellvibrio polysaccharolyticus]|uniref:hypothetical protein n=1 Tax=Cellvibrio polysaccharolyticus TaxID=2082724 RepID=UPI00187EC0E8|nr:hypothetical protein [Cellvibrio polysaccharolyticus]
MEIENFFDLKIILPPSILLEVQKTKDREKRIKTIKAMAKPWRYKSRTEVDLDVDLHLKLTH